MTSVGEIKERHLIKVYSVIPIKMPAPSDVRKPLKAAFEVKTSKSKMPYHMKSNIVQEPKSGIINSVNMDAHKYGVIDITEKLQEINQ